MLFELEDKVLLTQSMLDYSSRWHLVGGGIKKGETLLQGLAREVKEEIGIDIQASKLTQLNSEMLVAKNSYKYALFSYHLTDTPKITLRKYEITNAHFFPLDEIAQIKTSDTVQKALQLFALK